MPTASERRRTLRALVQAPGIVVAPSAHDALSALLVEDAGFAAVHVSGSGVARAFGYADTGLVTATELVAVHERVVEAVRIPVVGDAETGFGNAVNVARTVRAFERAGVSAIHLEDEYTPKRPGGLPGVPHGAIPVAEMVGKLKAALDARTDPAFMIVARSNARDAESFEALMERLQAYQETGVDAIWPGLRHPAEVRQLPGPLRLPLSGVPPRGRISNEEYGRYGFKIACLPVTLGQAAVAGMQAALATIQATGDREHLFTAIPDAAAARRWYERVGMGEQERIEREFAG